MYNQVVPSRTWSGRVAAIDPMVGPIFPKVTRARLSQENGACWRCWQPFTVQLSLRRSCARPNHARHTLERASLQCAEGVHSDIKLTLMVNVAQQVSMGRYRGVGMPRAKKKTVAVQEEAGPSCSEPDPAVLMPPPPPRPPKPAAAQAPSKDPDFEDRQFAGRVLKLAIKQHRAREREVARSEKRVAAAGEKNDAMDAKMDRLQRKKPRDPVKELSLVLKAEQYINKELMLHAQAMYAASSAESTMLKCQIKVKDLHIQHLLRRLRNGRK